MRALITTVLLAVASAVAVSPSSNMNGKAYKIANPNPDSPRNFSGEFSEYYPNSKYFEVYSPLISTVYGQVYWTMMEPVPLPVDIVNQFAGRTMAITGYESDQVMRTAQGDVPLPITAAYNHHYTGYVISQHAQLTKVVPKSPATVGHMESDGTVWEFVDARGPSFAGAKGPVSAALHEGNGGEFRQSFHGFPTGYAQLVESPTSFQMNPMQIDTWNRDNKNFDGFWPGPQPKNSEQPEGAPYSGLLECPCTDRIVKKVDGGVSAKLSGACASPITDAKSCAAAAQEIGAASIFKITAGAGRNASLPAGCSLTVHSSPAPQVNGAPQAEVVAFWNELNRSVVSCGQGAKKLFGSLSKGQSGLPNLGVWVETNTSHLRVVITGPSDVWFGVGLNASTMAAGTWAIIVDGDGNVTERALGAHQAGTLLPDTLTVESSQVHADQRRTVVVSRPLAETPTFKLSVAALLDRPVLDIIAATGSGKEFAYHAAKGSGKMDMFVVDSPTCICNAGAELPFGKGTGYLEYTPPPGEPGSPESPVPGANFTQLHFAKHCLDYPAGTMLLGKNPSCDLRAYTGGQSCCHHLFTLLDKDQRTPWADQPLEYHMKFRIYYEDNPELKNVVQHNWGGMATPTEYDVPKCSDGVEGCSFEDGHWVHRMNGTWTVGQMSNVKDAVAFATIHGHCHAPTCREFTLYNADTMEVICRQVPLFGHSNATYDEKGYLGIPPCVFGSPEEGLMRSPVLNSSQRLFSTKTCLADAGHHGEMSLWQTYGLY